MVKKGTISKPATPSQPPSPAPRVGKPSALLDTRVVYCGLRRAQSRGDNLEQLAKLPDACIDLIYIDPPFNSDRTVEQLGEIFWGETKEKRAFEDLHAGLHRLHASPLRATRWRAEEDRQFN